MVWGRCCGCHGGSCTGGEKQEYFVDGELHFVTSQLVVVRIVVVCCNQGSVRRQESRKTASDRCVSISRERIGGRKSQVNEIVERIKSR
jgi:hypothetical protein